MANGQSIPRLSFGQSFAIHLNPARAGLIVVGRERLKRQRWSSYPHANPLLDQPKNGGVQLGVVRCFHPIFEDSLGGFWNGQRLFRGAAIADGPPECLVQG